MNTTNAAGHKDHADTDATRPSASSQIDTMSEDRDFVASLARGLAVIQAFTNQQRHLSIAQVSYKTGITRAAVRRYLHTLTRLGYVRSEDGNRYSLLPKIVSLGHAYLSATPLSARAQPTLDRLSELVQESCSLAVLDGQDILYIARSSSSRIMSPSLNVGSRLPANCTSIGQVLMAHLPEMDLPKYLAEVKFRPYTKLTITSADELRTTLERVRKDGFAIADQQLEVGLRSIAVPVRNTAGEVVAGINIIVQSARTTITELKTRFLPPLREAAEELGPILSR